MEIKITLTRDISYVFQVLKIAITPVHDIYNISYILNWNTHYFATSFRLVILCIHTVQYVNDLRDSVWLALCAALYCFVSTHSQLTNTNKTLKYLNLHVAYYLHDLMGSTNMSLGPITSLTTSTIIPYNISYPGSLEHLHAALSSSLPTLFLFLPLLPIYAYSTLLP